MNIKFKSLEREEGQKANGDVWVAYKIHGTKLEDGTDWISGNIFDNKFKADLLAQLRELDEGDKIGVSHKKNDQGYWEITGIGPVQASQGRPTQTASGQRRSGGSGGKSSGDQMTKAEWAEKNKVDALRIAKSVALKAAVENTKVGATAESVVKMAEAFMPFLTNDQLNAADDVPFDSGDDGLSAPTV